LKTKGNLKVKVMNLLTDLKIAGVYVQIIRCNNSGENKALHEECLSKGYGIKLEFSGPRTPQRNGKVERKFQTLFGRIRAMLNGAGLKDDLRSGVWAECAVTVTFLSNITSVKNQEVCPHQLLFGCKPKLLASLRSFGEIGVVNTKDTIQGKLKNKGTPCMFVGFSEHHAYDVYRMLNLETEMIIKSRDSIWLSQVHKEWILNKPNNQPNYDDNDGVEVMIQSVNTSQNAPEEVKDRDELKRIKLYKQNSWDSKVSNCLAQ
jgi:hypothetical protein